MNLDQFSSNAKMYKLPVHQSHIKDYMFCPRLYYWKYKAGMEPKGFSGESDSATIGTLFDLMVNSWWEGKAREVGINTCDVYMGGRVAAWIENGGSQSMTLDDYRRKLSKFFGVALAMYDTFVSVYEKPPHLKVIEVQKTIKGKIQTGKNNIIDVAGTLDLILQDRKTSSLWIWDNKTLDANLSIRKYSDTWAYDPQVWMYRELVNWEYGEYPVGFIFCVAKRPTIRQKQTESYDEYLERVRTWYLAEGEYQGKKAEWLRDPPLSVYQQPINPKLRIPPDVFHSIRMVGAASKCSQHPSLLKHERMFPRSTSHNCFGFGGACAYQVLCSKPDTSEYAGILDGMFKPVKFQPEVHADE